MNFVLYKARREYKPKASHENDSYRHLALNIGDYVFVSGNRLNNMLEAELLSGHNGFVPRECVERVEESDFLEMATVKKMFAQLSKNNQNDVSLSVGNTTLGCELDLSSGDETASPEKSHDSSTKIICFADTTLANTSGELVPPPTNLACDTQMEDAIVVSWSPPTPEGCVLRYLVLINDAIFIEIAAKRLKMYRTILDGIDMSRVNRVSVKAVSDNGSCSATSACTSLFGEEAEPYPSELLVSFVTCDSATVTWLPGDSNMPHAILIDDVQGGVMPPGVYSTIVSGLKPQTSYHARVVPMEDEQITEFEASIEITTKPTGPLEPPLEVSLGSGLVDGKVRIQWLPLSACLGKTNALKITAYAVFANLSKVMGEEFAPVLGELVPHLVKVIGQDEGQLEQADEAAAVSFHLSCVCVAPVLCICIFKDNITNILQRNYEILLISTRMARLDNLPLWMIPTKRTRKAIMSFMSERRSSRPRRVPSLLLVRWLPIPVPPSAHILRTV